MLAPELALVAELKVRIHPPVEIPLSGGRRRRMIPIRDGEVMGPRLRGRVLPGGADFQIIHPDGLTELEARYVIELAEGGLVYVENRGLRHGPPHLMEKMRVGEVVDPALIYFRAAPRFETSAPGYEWLMRSLFLCAAARYPDRVEMSFYEVL